MPLGQAYSHGAANTALFHSGMLTRNFPVGTSGTTSPESVSTSLKIPPSTQARGVKIRHARMRFAGFQFLGSLRDDLFPILAHLQRVEQIHPVDGFQEFGQAFREEAPILVLERFDHLHAAGQSLHRAAHVDRAAHHADAGALAEHRGQPLAIVAAHHRDPAAHEFEREGSGAFENPKLGRGVGRVVLHQRTGPGAGPAADVDHAVGRAVAGGVAAVAAHDDPRAGVQPAHVGRGGPLDHDLGAGHAHRADALAGVGHREAQFAPEPAPQRSADIVLAGGVDDEFGFALGHGGVNPLQEFLRGSALVIFERSSDEAWKLSLTCPTPLL